MHHCSQCLEEPLWMPWKVTVGNLGGVSETKMPTCKVKDYVN